MIKIPLSYRIIKNDTINCDDNSSKAIETKIKQPEINNNKEKASSEISPQKLFELKKSIKQELMEEIEEERAQMIMTVEKQCDDLKSSAMEQGYQEGFALGMEKGHKEGIDKGKDEAAVIKNNAVNMVEQAQREVSQYFVENRKNIIELAVNMAESIIHATIDTSSENIMLLIKPILQQYGKKETIIISTHPDNMEFIRGNLNEMEKIAPGSKIFILENKNLDKNGCIIENEHQIIDLQIKDQLHNLQNSLSQWE